MRRTSLQRSLTQLPVQTVVSKPNSRVNSQLRRKSALIRSILVPVDFSDCSLAGLKYAVALAREIAARVVVLHVIDLGPVMMSLDDYGSAAHVKAARRRTHDSMRSFLRRIDFNGVPVVSLSVAGYCPDAIYETAAKERADLIVMSTHGRTGLRHAFMGSVAEGTIRHARLPVLVVPSFTEQEHNASQSRQEEPCQPLL